MNIEEKRRLINAHRDEVADLNIRLNKLCALYEKEIELLSDSYYKRETIIGTIAVISLAVNVILMWYFK